MNSLLKILKYMAYLNIPLMLGALYFIYQPIFTGDVAGTVDNSPKAILLMGFALSFTSLRDVKKIDKFGRFIIERKVLLSILLFFAIGRPLLFYIWLDTNGGRQIVGGSFLRQFFEIYFWKTMNK